MKQPEHDVDRTEDRKRVASYLEGDRRVFKEVDGWIRSELGLRYPRLRGEHADLSQAVHAKLLTCLREGQFEGRSTLRTYVTRIVNRTAIDRLRSLYRERALTEQQIENRSPAGGNPYDPRDILEEQDLLRQVLLTLPANCRVLWKLIFVDELPFDEIAAELGVPEGTVKSRAFYCRKTAIAAYRRFRHRLKPR